MKEIISIIILPVLAGLLLFLIPEKLKTINGLAAVLISIITGYLTVVIYSSGNQVMHPDESAAVSGFIIFGLKSIMDAARYLVFNSDNLSKLIILFISLFTFLILLY